MMVGGIFITEYRILYIKKVEFVFNYCSVRQIHRVLWGETGQSTMGNCCPCLKPDTHSYQEVPQNVGKKLSFDRHINTVEVEKTVVNPTTSFEIPSIINEDEVSLFFRKI